MLTPDKYGWEVVFPKSHAGVAVVGSAVPDLGLLFTAVCMYLLCKIYIFLYFCIDSEK